MSHSLFDVVVFLVAVIAGGIAALSGFGIGSFLTPFLATTMGMKAAVTAVSIPHFITTVSLLWGLKGHVDRRMLFHFGACSAGGGLLGALLQSKASSPTVRIVFSALLLFAGVSGLADWSERMPFQRRTAWIAGALSGLFGGLVGNQGEIRSAALLNFKMKKENLVATATAIGVIVDIARIPIYLATQTQVLISAKTYIVIALVGSLVGTFLGARFLERIPARLYRKVLSLLICTLGIYMVYTCFTQ